MRRGQGTFSALLIALLIGQPAAIAVCEAWCAEAPTAVTHVNHGGLHQHQAAAGQTAVAVQDDAAVHEHDRSSTSPVAATANLTVVTRSHGPAGCDRMTPMPSVTAVRADAGLLAQPVAAAAGPAAPVEARDLLFERSPRAFPPGSLTAFRSPLVLRI